MVKIFSVFGPTVYKIFIDIAVKLLSSIPGHFYTARFLDYFSFQIQFHGIPLVFPDMIIDFLRNFDTR